MHPKVCGVYPKLTPKRGLVQFCRDGDLVPGPLWLARGWQVDEEPLLPSYRTSQFATSRAEWGRAGGASQPPRVREST